MKRLAIFGAGGHAREVHQLVDDINGLGPTWELIGGIVDAQYVSQSFLHGLPVFAATEVLVNRPELAIVVAVGEPDARAHIVERLRLRAPRLFPCLVHPRAWVARRAVLGEGSLVFAGSLINCDVKLGCHVSVNLGVTISHDCVIGDFVSLGPGVHLAGGATIGQGSDLGTGVCVCPGVRVGVNCVVGAGSVVTADLEPGVIAYGVPARRVGLRS
jgi:sugar O-acyltransferase (sialic acid O-acetyltransferase NeuD family)